MASATASTRNRRASDRAGGREAERDDSQLRWSRGWSLTARILAVNLFAVLMLAGGILYLDSFRERLLDQRVQQMRIGAELLATSLGDALTGNTPGRAARLAEQFGNTTQARLRIYDADGRKVLDSWTLTGPTFYLRDPEAEPFTKDIARFLDRMIEGAVGARPLQPFVEPSDDRRGAWREAERAARDDHVTAAMRRAPDQTVIVTSAAPMPGGRVLHLTADARDITRVVRDERFTLFVIFLGVLTLSMLLSSFLARTIVRPLRRLAVAAQRVRLGRSREVTIPRFSRRRDEIGELSRTLSDMTAALRLRIDATEAFAADVAHEIKNPLASLRSAVEGLGQVQDPALRGQLLDVVRDDVGRIDRLISDISNASRLDAELSRTSFEPVDIGAMVATLIGIYETRKDAEGVTLAFARPLAGTAVVMGDDGRLAQVARNIIDNAISFSPPGGLVQITVARAGDRVIFRVDDSGPGISPERVDRIFGRFYSERPEGEAFGKHSGLGLAIARAIVEAHDGTISAENLGRDGERSGARFTVSLPAAA
jgi:two-component system sensor histidine kinase ChvG